jgi:mannose/fructose/N-acetylgalactosamine-specific phosphotransferase system component IIC
MAMEARTALQLAIAATGLLVWGYGQRVDSPGIRWVAIGIFGIAMAFRFARRRREQRAAEAEGDQPQHGTSD